MTYYFSGQTTDYSSSRVIDSLPDRMIDSLPNQMIDSLSDRMIDSLPDQMIDSLFGRTKSLLALHTVPLLIRLPSPWAPTTTKSLRRLKAHEIFYGISIILT